MFTHTLPARVAPLLASLVIMLAAPVAAQPSWEFSPYRIRLWCQVASSLPLPADFSEQLAKDVALRADAAVGAAWSLEPDTTPSGLVTDLATNLLRLGVKRIEAARPAVLESDKLFLLTVGGDTGEYLIHARELDCRTRLLGPVAVRRTTQSDQVAAQAFNAILDAFAAMVRMEAGADFSLIVRVRAGGLVLHFDSPAHVGTGDILEPIVRRNDRLGRISTADVVDWTYLQVTGLDPNNPNLRTVDVHSAWRSPIRARVSSRREQYALAVRPRFTASNLLIAAHVARGEIAYPLQGLEVYVKEPSDSAAAPEIAPPRYLGVTDWRGAVNVRRGDSPLLLVYVKNGGRLLARLPVVPGLSRTLHVELPDDDPRLQAEGSIQGFNAQLMDLIAHRSILASGIRRKIQEGRIKDAQQLVERFSQLPTRSDMQRRLDQQIRRQAISRNRMVQNQIDGLYLETRSALTNFLKPGLRTALLREVREAVNSE